MRRDLKKLSLLAGVTLVLTTLARTGSVQGSPSPAVPYAPDEKPFGMSLAEWEAAWYQWFVSIPVASGPTAGSKGKFAGVGQRMPVWFLPAFSADKTVSQIVPAGYALFVPVTGELAEDVVGSVKLDFTQNKARQIAKDLDQLPVPNADIDGVAVPDLARYRVQTPVFSFILPEGNVLGRTDVPSGGVLHEEAIAEGYHFLMPPLPVGKHVIHTQATVFTGRNTTGTVNVTYQLTVADWPRQ